MRVEIGLIFLGFSTPPAAMSENVHLAKMFGSTVVRAHVSAAGAKGATLFDVTVDRTTVCSFFFGGLQNNFTRRGFASRHGFIRRL